MPYRIDNGEILKHEFTPEGYLRCYMRVGRVGELRYKEDDGTERIEIVTPEVLFDKQHLDSLKMKPITREHPNVDRLDSTNATKYQVGMSGHAVVIDGEFLGVVGTIVDQELIDEIVKKERQECSLGYDCVIVPRKDGKYEQRDRRVNHIAICKRARAGSAVKIRMDSMRKKIQDMSEEELKTLVADAVSKQLKSMLGEEEEEHKKDTRSDANGCKKGKKGMPSDESLYEDEELEDEELEDEDEELEDEDEEELTKQDSLENEAFELKIKNHYLTKHNDSLERELQAMRSKVSSPAEIINFWEKTRPLLKASKDSLRCDGLDLDEEMEVYTLEPSVSLYDIKVALLKASDAPIDYDNPDEVDIAYRLLLQSPHIYIPSDKVIRNFDRLIRSDSDIVSSAEEARRKSQEEDIEAARNHGKKRS